MRRSRPLINNQISLPLPAFLLLLSLSATIFAQGQWKCAAGAAQFSARQGHESVVFQNKMWVMNGYYQKTNKYDIWNSSDGMTWTKIIDDSSLFPMHAHFPTVVNDGYIWILGGEPGC